jgi:hypothetical protein
LNCSTTASLGGGVGSLGFAGSTIGALADGMNGLAFGVKELAPTLNFGTDDWAGMLFPW